MVLVDTSVLIGYLKGSSGKPYEILDEIIDKNIVFGICNHIYQEILQGVKTEKEYFQLKEYLDVLPFYDLHNGRKSYENAALLYIRCRKAGITIRSTIDLIIAQTAIENQLLLLHNDNDFINLSRIIPELKLYNS